MSCLSALQTEALNLPESVLAQLVAEARFRQQEEGERTAWQRLCDQGSDADIIEAAVAEIGSPAVVLAETYEYIHPRQEIVAWAVRGHPRRPVLMRGSRASRIGRFALSEGSTSANGWAVALFERFLRLARVNAFDFEEYQAQTRSIGDALRQRFALTSAFGHYTNGWFVGWRHGEVMLAGKWRNFSASELANIKALRAIIAKTDKLEARVQSAKLHWQERMAA